MKTLIIFWGISLLGCKAAGIRDLHEGNKKFAGALYSDTPNWNRDTDILLSPFSLQTVLALTQSGAKGATAEEIRSGASLPPETESSMKNTLSTIQSKISNKVFVENGFSTNEDFKTVASDVYRSSFENVEFINSAPTSKIVNDWASEQTNNRFGSSFSSFADYTKLSKDLLVNILQVKKNWSNPFLANQTKSELFYVSNTHFAVSMMTQGPFLYNYHESTDLDAKFLEMPLGDKVSFTIVLPNAVNGLPKIEKQIDVALTTPDYVQEFIQVSFPRTGIQATRLDLKGSMQRLGINNVFSNDKADLSGMSGVPGQLAAFNLLHDTHISIDESGIEAAAGGLVNVRVPSTKHFNVNHAFFFYVKVDGIIVFVGKVVNPSYVVHH